MNFRNEVLVSLSLGEGDTTLRDVQLLPLGKWRHPAGVIDITPERAQRFAEQFARRVAGQDLPVLYIHSDKGNVANPRYGEAAGWITGMRADPSRGLLIDIDFSEEGAAAVRSKKYRYLSAEYFDKVQLPHHKAPEADVLVGAALVNRPHLKGMDPILNEETGHQFLAEVADASKKQSDQGGGPVDPILLALAKSAGIELADDATELTEGQRDKLTAFLEGQARSLEDLATSNSLLQKKLDEKDPMGARAKSLAEAGFDEEATLLLEYKAEKRVRTLSESLPEGKSLTPAVRELVTASVTEGDPTKFDEAFALVASGKGMIDLVEHGTTLGNDDDGDEPADLGDKINQLAEVEAKEKQISFAEALDVVQRKNPALWNEYQRSMGSNKAVMEVR